MIIAGRTGLSREADQGRSSRSCRSPRPPTAHRRPGVAIRRSCRPAPLRLS